MEEVVEMWARILDQVKRQSKNFNYWFELIKRDYFSVFYPVLAKEEGFFPVQRQNVVSFSEWAPHPIQRIILNWLREWIYNIPISMIFWNRENAPLMMEILRQSCRLPMSFGPSIRLSLELYRTWLLSGMVSAQLLDTRIQEYWRGFLGHTAAIITTSWSSPDEARIHSELTTDVLDIYGFFAFYLNSDLDKDTWIHLQCTLLDTISDYLKSAVPTNLSSFTIIDDMFHALFLYWMQSPVTTQDMWSYLSQRLTELTAWKQLISQWKEKVLSLTILLTQLIYEAPVLTTKNKRARASVFGFQELLQEVQSGLPPDHPVGAIKWSIPRLQSVWFTTLNILGNPVNISNAPNYIFASSCLYEIVDYLIHAEDRLPHNQSPPIPIFEIFLPWILQIALDDDRERNRARLHAYTTLCRMFCRQHLREMEIG